MKKRINLGDEIFPVLTKMFAVCCVVLIFLIGVMLLKESSVAFKKFGFKFFITKQWDPILENYGALAFIYGTVVSSFLALFISVPISLGVALFLSEFASDKIKEFLSTIVSLLAGIPSVIYGLWGIFVLAPILRKYIEPFFQKILGFLPFFQGEPYGLDMFAAGIVLSIMITPTISSISKDVFEAVPRNLREAALAIGATKWEMIKIAVLKPARQGVFGAIILGLGRAVGETMAVTMVIGNVHEISLSLFHPAATLASVIANEFAEAVSEVYISSLFLIGTTLFIVTFILNVFAKLLIRSVTKQR
ncbi:MAG: phosphate ABC transporter permease subunit PstC [Elusimicrobiota bacterium]|nr:phosphate ABC transporter permease subunit PstC [Elusimicrobiota bacterium]